MKRLFALVFTLCLLVSAALAGESAPVLVDGVPVPAGLAEMNLATVSLMANAGGNDSQTAQDAARAEVLSALAREQACLNDAERNGITLTGEVLADADERYTAMIARVEDYVHVSYPGLDGKELDEQVDSLLKVAGASRETYRLLAERAALMAAYEAFLLSNMPMPGEEALQAEYDWLLSEQKPLFDSDENAFEAALLSGEAVVYRPRDLKLIQKAEFKFDTEVIQVLRNLRQVSPEAAAETEEEEYARMDGIVTPIHESLLKGEISFAKVLEDLKEGSSGQVNYFHESSTRFGEDYYSRAAAFDTVGQISTVYRIPNGCAILYYVGDLPACERVPLEEVRDVLASIVLEKTESGWLKENEDRVFAAAEIVYPEEQP